MSNHGSDLAFKDTLAVYPVILRRSIPVLFHEGGIELVKHTLGQGSGPVEHALEFIQI